MTLPEHNALVDEIEERVKAMRLELRLLEREYQKAREEREREHGPQRPVSSPVIAHIPPPKSDPGLTVRPDLATKARRRK